MTAQNRSPYQKPAVISAALRLDFEEPVDESAGERLEAAATELQNRAGYTEAGRLEETSWTVQSPARPGGKPRVAAARSMYMGTLLRRDGEQGVVVQMKRDGLLAEVRKNPAGYPGWQVLREAAVEAWKALRQAVGNEPRVVRVGVRYQNRFSFESEQVELDDYFRVAPQLPAEAGALAGLSVEMIVPQEADNGVLAVRQSIVPPPEGKAIGIALDLELYSVPQPSGFSDEEAWELLDRFHEREYECFELFITDRAREEMR